MTGFSILIGCISAFLHLSTLVVRDPDVGRNVTLSKSKGMISLSFVLCDFFFIASIMFSLLSFYFDMHLLFCLRVHCIFMWFHHTGNLLLSLLEFFLNWTLCVCLKYEKWCTHWASSKIWPHLDGISFFIQPKLKRPTFCIFSFYVLTISISL